MFGFDFTSEYVHASTNAQFTFTLLQEQIASRQLERYKIGDGTALFEDYIQLAYKNIKFIGENRNPIGSSQKEA